MSILVKKVTLNDDLQKCLTIRTTVFIEGQHVPIHEERDGKDDYSDHYLLLMDDVPAGTARVRYIDDTAKIERVAILDAYQGQGLGRAIMTAILSDLRQCGAVVTVKLSSQTYAIPFYEKLGFVICSEEYMDAGIPHQDMKLYFNC